MKKSLARRLPMLVAFIALPFAGVRCSCSDTPDGNTGAHHSIGGTVSGLVGTGLVLQNNGVDDLAVPAYSSSFTFATKLINGASYAVTVKTQPSGPAQTCTVDNGTGVVADAEATGVAVACTTINAPAVPTNVSVAPGVQQAVISWDTVADATSYNLYFSNTSGVTKANGTKIANAIVPFTHTTLQVGTYYYVVTAVNAGGESAESVEMSVPINLLVFITSTSGDGNMSTWADAGGKVGLAAADAICNARASAAGLTGVFTAWLSDGNDDAYCRVHNLSGKMSANCDQVNLPASAGPWVRIDGFPFAETIDRLLTNGQIYSPIRFDETGTVVAADAYCFTNTFIDGSVDYEFPASCSNWTSNSNADTDVVVGGSPDMTTNTWTLIFFLSCQETKHLICMQTGPGPALDWVPTSGKRVFVTSARGTGDLSTWSGAGTQTGVAAGDAICQSLADAAGLGGTFKAWLSDATTNAVDRLTSAGPWVRLDGVKIATDKADLTKGSIFTSINLTETGTYLGHYGVWSGTTDNGLKTVDTCNNWTDGTTNYHGSFSSAANAGYLWSGYSTGFNCDSPCNLRCFED
jgi:hypothetical protein